MTAPVTLVVGSMVVRRRRRVHLSPLSLPARSRLAAAVTLCPCRRRRALPLTPPCAPATTDAARPRPPSLAAVSVCPLAAAACTCVAAAAAAASPAAPTSLPPASSLSLLPLPSLARSYASLYFVACVGAGDNELLTLEVIHQYVEVLDRYFGNVCELDIIFNFHKAYYILDELLLGGELQETNKREVLRVCTAQDDLAAEDEGGAAAVLAGKRR